MKKNSLLIATLFAGSIALMFSSCREDAIVKASIAPGNNVLNTDTLGDTVTVITKTGFIEKLNTSEKQSGLRVIHGLGTVVDPYFGRTNAGIAFQVIPAVTSGFSFTGGNAYTIDSAVLILPYAGFSWGNYGDPEEQKLRVYELTEQLSIDQEYYSNQVVGINRSNPISDLQSIDFKAKLDSEPILGTGDTTDSKHLRIPLNQAFIDKFDNEVRNNKDVSFASESAFLNFLKGIYIEPDTNQNTDLLSYFYLDGNSNYNRAAIAFYYREDGDNTTKTAFFNYVRDKTANYNWIGRNYTGRPAQDLINNYNNTINKSDDTIVLQNEPGAVLDIRMPYLSNLPQVTIVKAEIVITQVKTGNNADTMLTPNRITPRGVDENGEEYTIADYDVSNVSAAIDFVDGNKLSEKDQFNNDIIRYRINVPKEVQKIINGERKELHLRIKGAKGYPAAYRLVAGGRTHSNYKVQLNIVYSKPD